MRKGSQQRAQSQGRLRVAGNIRNPPLVSFLQIARVPDLAQRSYCLCRIAGDQGYVLSQVWMHGRPSPNIDRINRHRGFTLLLDKSTKTASSTLVLQGFVLLHCLQLRLGSELALCHTCTHSGSARYAAGHGHQHLCCLSVFVSPGAHVTSRGAPRRGEPDLQHLRIRRRSIFDG